MYIFIVSSIFYFILISSNVEITRAVNQSENVYTRLHRKLFSNYDKRVRPVANPRKSILVSMEFFPLHVHVDESIEEINLAGYIVMIWRDEYLQWNPKEFDGVNTIKAVELDIWMPHMISYSMGYSKFSDENPSFKTFYVLLNSKGVVHTSAHVVYNGYCKMDFKHWPHNELDCSMVIGSELHLGTDEVTYRYRNNNSFFDGQFLRKNKEWDLSNISATCIPFRADYGNKTLCLLTYNMNLKRHTTLYEATYVNPGGILAGMMLVSFWMQEYRMILQLFVMLAQVCYLIFLRMVLNNNGTSEMLIVRFFADTFLMNIIAITLTVINMSLLKNYRFPPRIIMNIVDKISGIPYVGCFFQSNIRPNYEESGDDNTALTASNSRPSTVLQEWTQVVTFIDRSFFIIYGIMIFYFWIFLLP